MGKSASLMKFQASLYFCHLCEIFNNKLSKQDIVATGKSLLVCLYGGEDDVTLDSLRYKDIKCVGLLKFFCTYVT